MADFWADPIIYASKLTGRRIIKCHLPMEMQPKDLVEKCKVVYVARNIKDMAVSWFHHMVNMTPHDFKVRRKKVYDRLYLPFISGKL